MNKLLIPIDGSEAVDRAIQMAISICKKREEECHITLLHVVSIENFPNVGVSGITANVDEAVKKEGRKLLENAIGKINNKGIKIDAVLLEGSPRNAICEYTDKNNYDLIVMGNRGKGAIKELFLGSVSKKVLDDTKCPVLIVK
ncbi:universal stress protein [Scopulibacillus cellulosilyticus]|uniref:Universal stress protein n=1 Tax=Scopulibacillus cellulosilyticus TaxID=2665665 RepID=A0ABW2Q4D5_9BACL